ncbi:putative aluminum-activated malate transporter [Helianthus anomalus]
MDYYIRPLYKGGLGDAGICAIVTVIEVFDYTVGFGGEYYRVSDGDKPLPEEAYKSILDSQAIEESLHVGCASWELGHGKFGLGYPWEEYLKIGVYTRQCAYHIKALSGYLDAKLKVPSEF